MMGIPVLDTTEFLELLKEEIDDVYRDRKDTFIRVRTASILVTRSGRSLIVRPLIPATGQTEPSAIAIQVSGATEVFGIEEFKTYLPVLLIAFIIFLEWRRYIHDPFVDLYYWVGMILVAAGVGGMAFAVHRNRKESDKVFPQKEIERLRTRLKLRLEAEQGTVSREK